MRAGFVFLLSFLLLGGVFSQGLNVYEGGIYNELRESYMGDIIQNYPADPSKHFDQVFRKVAKRYGISLSRLEDIYTRGNTEHKITNQEAKMAAEFWKKMREMPARSTGQDRLRALKEIAEKYKVNIEKVKNAAFRTM